MLEFVIQQLMLLLFESFVICHVQQIQCQALLYGLWMGYVTYVNIHNSDCFVVFNFLCRIVTCVIE